MVANDRMIHRELLAGICKLINGALQNDLKEKCCLWCQDETTQSQPDSDRILSWPTNFQLRSEYDHRERQMGLVVLHNQWTAMLDPAKSLAYFIRIVCIFSPCLPTPMKRLLMFLYPWLNFLTLLLDDTQAHERWLVRVKPVVLPVSPTTTATLYGLIWHCGHCEHKNISQKEELKIFRTAKSLIETSFNMW